MRVQRADELVYGHEYRVSSHNTRTGQIGHFVSFTPTGMALLEFPTGQLLSWFGITGLSHVIDRVATNNEKPVQRVREGRMARVQQEDEEATDELCRVFQETLCIALD